MKNFKKIINLYYKFFILEIPNLIQKNGAVDMSLDL